jgi:predicted transcriptional regulator
MQPLTITTPENLTWQYEQITFSILGGIKLEGLERLRVTIKAEFKQIAIRHNLDLYNDSQLEKFSRKCAERFEIGTIYLNKAIGELINQLESYRLNEIAIRVEKPTTAKQLTPEETQAATSFLQSENLLTKTNELIGKSGMIGEEQNRLLMYLIFTSRKREQPLHIISLASSGSGKSYLQEKVSELIPEEDKVEITVLSENAFYYFGQRELKHKLILIEDLDGAENVLYPLRELQSKRRISKTVAHKDGKGNTKTISLTVEGPVSVAGCTTQESIYEDNANRSFLIYLDESQAQDERIMQRQRALSAGIINTVEEQNIKTLMSNAQRLLQPINVRNPYAEYLQIPNEVFKPRRTNSHYLQFIEAITFYKQYQRSQQIDPNTGELYIETTIEDIQEANQLIKEILLRKSDELNGACRNYLEQLKQHLQSTQTKGFTSKEMSKTMRIALSTVKRHHLHLINNGYIKQMEVPKGEKAYCYEIVNYDEYQALENSINNALDKALAGIPQTIIESQQPNGSLSAQLAFEPMQPNGSAEEGHRLNQPTERSKRQKKINPTNS